MKLGDLLKDIELKKINKADMSKEITGICNNSRKVEKDNVFAAVKGYKTDGSIYAATAVKSGAYCVVTEEELDSDIPYILVDDARKALAAMSAEWFGNPSRSFKLIGVTGTNGKTTTTYLLKTIIEKITGEKTGVIGTNQILIGDESVQTERTTPESYELQKLFADMRDAGCKYVIMEVSSHALYLNRVFKCDFDIGIFTNLTQDHLDFHGTMENYLKAKAMLFDMCRIGVINVDDDASEYLIEKTSSEKFLFGVNRDNGDITAKNIRLSAAGISYEAVMNGAIARISLGIPGMFSVYNSLGAVSASVALGFSIDAVAEAMKSVAGVRGRAEVVMRGEYTVMVDYAHTPDGMENILKSVKEFTAGRLICVFGCGGDRDALKRPKMGMIASQLSDIAIVTSDNPRTESPRKIIEDILAGIDRKKNNPIIIEDRHEAIRYALQMARKDDFILILGKGHETYQEVNGIKGHFDDREEVMLFLKKQM